MESVDSRKIELLDWLLSSCGLRSISLLPMPGDASTRRYFRVICPDASFVLMDAPLPQDKVEAFIAVGSALSQHHITVPTVVFKDLTHDYLLLSDLGDLTYLNALTNENADTLYGKALEALVSMQAITQVPDHVLPVFDAKIMHEEWALFKEWYLTKLLKLDIAADEKKLDACYALLVESALSQPVVFMHRDYHSANLMVLPDDAGVGVLDFQDAFMGPVTYDLVSLLRDCYIAWPNERVVSWVNAYRLILKAHGVMDIEQTQMMRWFDLMGVQRHLKALMTFSRKQVRDHQSRYLSYIPRTLGYLLHTTEKYPELSAFTHLLETAREVSDRCVA